MNLRKKFFRYVIPSVASMWVFSIYTMADGIFVANGVGSQALAAVNLSMPFINLVFAISLLFATGTSTVVSIAMGKGDGQEANKLFTMNVATVSVVSLVVTTLCLTNLDTVARFLGAEGELLAGVKEYLGIIIGFNGFFMVSYSLEVLVKTDGFPALATLGVCTGAVTNIVLDALFVLVFGWGLRGAAIATGLSQLVTAAVFLTHFLKKRANLRFVRFRFKPREMLRIMSIGLADCVTELSSGVIIFLFNRAILGLVGDWALAPYTAISYVNTLVLMTMVGITQGMQPLVSFYCGKGEHKQCFRLLRMALCCAAVCAAVAFGISQLGGHWVMSIFMDEAERGFAYGASAFRTFSLSFLLLGFNVVLAGFFAAMERPAGAMTISIGRGMALSALALAVTAALWGGEGIWLAPALSELICLMLSLVLYRVFFGKKAMLKWEQGMESKRILSKERESLYAE